MPGDIYIDFFSVRLEGTVNTDISRFFQFCFVIRFPGNRIIFLCSVRISCFYRSWKFNIFCLYGCIEMFHHPVTCNFIFRYLLPNCRNLCRCRRKVICRKIYGDLSSFFHRTDNYQRFSCICIDLCRSAAKKSAWLLEFL